MGLTLNEPFNFRIFSWSLLFFFLYLRTELHITVPCVLNGFKHSVRPEISFAHWTMIWSCPELLDQRQPVQFRAAVPAGNVGRFLVLEPYFAILLIPNPGFLLPFQKFQIFLWLPEFSGCIPEFNCQAVIVMPVPLLNIFLSLSLRIAYSIQPTDWMRKAAATFLPVLMCY